MAAQKYHDGSLYFIFLMLTVCILYTVEGVLVDVRLANGTMPNEGTVWYTQDCQNWYRTCGSGLGIQDVIVICRHLGFAGANRALMDSTFGGPFDNQLQMTIECGEEEGDITTCTLMSGCSGSTGGAVCYGSNYLGCYKDMPGNGRVLNDQENLSIGGLTIDKCLDFCRSFPDMVFAGLQLGNECYCGESSSNYNKHGPVSPDSQCTYQCDGDQYQSCGGGGFIAIFNLTADPHLPPNPMDSPCSMTTPPISTTSSTVTESTVQTTTSRENSSMSNTITSYGGPTTSIGSGLTGTVTGPGLTSASSSPPGGSTTTSYAAIGGGVAAAVVLCIIIVIILVYRCKCKPKENNKRGVGLEEMACEKSPPTEYETTIMAFPDASGSDTLRMEVKDDQQGEIEKEPFTPQMVEYENMKGRDNPGFMEPVHIYESMTADARGKTAVTLKEA